MKKILILFLIIATFSFESLPKEKRGIIKIERDGYKILVVPIKYRKSADFKKIINSSTGNLRAGKAEDINFIRDSLKTLREKGILKPNMYIFVSDLDYRELHPTTSNFMVTHKDSLNPFKNKKLKYFFLLREYK